VYNICMYVKTTFDLSVSITFLKVYIRKQRLYTRRQLEQNEEVVGTK